MRPMKDHTAFPCPLLTSQLDIVPLKTKTINTSAVDVCLPHNKNKINKHLAGPTNEKEKFWLEGFELLSHALRRFTGNNGPKFTFCPHQITFKNILFLL